MGFTAEHQFEAEWQLKTQQQFAAEQFGSSRWRRVHKLGFGGKVEWRQEWRQQRQQGRWLKGLVDGATRVR